jgi:galactokinase
MVVASTLAFLALNSKLDGVSKGQLVEMAMENEKRVGVNSGGMDQAASVISTPAAALYISFFPRLHAEPVQLPGAGTGDGDGVQAAMKGASFVCMNSLVVSNKAVGAKTQYNLRVVETLVGARVLARQLGVALDQDPNTHAAGTKRERITMREVLGRWLGVEEKKGGEREGGLSEEQMKEGLIKLLATEVEKLKPVGAVEDAEMGVTMEEMIQLSGLEKAEFDEVYLSWVEVEAERFQLYKRAKHVFSEALRVLQFREVCLQASSSSEISLFLYCLVHLLMRLIRYERREDSSRARTTHERQHDLMRPAVRVLTSSP